jgi:hypothetical protein
MREFVDLLLIGALEGLVPRYNLPKPRVVFPLHLEKDGFLATRAEDVLHGLAGKRGEEGIEHVAGGLDSCVDELVAGAEQGVGGVTGGEHGEVVYAQDILHDLHKPPVLAPLLLRHALLVARVGDVHVALGHLGARGGGYRVTKGC